MSYATWTEPTEIDRNKVRRYAPIRLRGEIVPAIIVELIMVIYSGCKQDKYVKEGL